MSMVKAIGVDMVKISRITRILQGTHRDRFLNKVLHKKELESLARSNPERVSQFVAGSWAAKEAVFKTLDRKDQLRFQFRDWYRYNIEGKPNISRVKPLSNDRFLLSISHDGDHLIATVLRLE
ncbi:hypothetical protein OXX69_011711 [Metschnikowia pulcherrima]